MNIIQVILSQLPIALDNAAVPPSAGEQLLSFALSPSGIASIVGTLGTVLGLVVGGGELRRRRVALAVNAAFHIVEDLAAATDGQDGFDKAEQGLKALDQYLLAHGWRAAKLGEQDVAKLQFSALNGAQKAATKTYADASIQALDVTSSVPGPEPVAAQEVVKWILPK